MPLSHYHMCTIIGTSIFLNEHSGKTIIPFIITDNQLITICILCILLVISIIIYYKEKRKNRSITRQISIIKEQQRIIEELNSQHENSRSQLLIDFKLSTLSISSQINLLISKEELNENQKAIARSITLNSEYVRIAANNYIMLSKKTDNTNQIKKREEKAFLIIKRIIKLFESVSKTKTISLSSSINGNIEELMWFDPQIVYNIIFNIMSNMIHITAAGGNIVLISRTFCRNGKRFLDLNIKSSDPNSQLSTANQVDTSQTIEELQQRFGLSKALAKQLNANLAVEMYDRYTREIHLTLDVERDLTTETITPEQKKNSVEYNLIDKTSILKLFDPQKEINHNTNSLNKHLLVIDSNENTLNEISQLLKQNYNILLANTGGSGLEIILSQRPDIIITNLIMPDLHGTEIIRYIKQIYSTTHIPVILMNEDSSDEWIGKALKAGADAIFPKKRPLSELLLLVNNILATQNIHTNEGIMEFEKKEEYLGLSDKELIFMKRITQLIEDNISNDSFGIDDIMEALQVSRTFLHVKLKKITNLSTTIFIRSIKMKHAQKMLQDGIHIKEVSFALGINDPNYFSKCFKKEFGISPTMYTKLNQ